MASRLGGLWSDKSRLPKKMRCVDMDSNKAASRLDLLGMLSENDVSNRSALNDFSETQEEEGSAVDHVSYTGLLN